MTDLRDTLTALLEAASAEIEPLVGTYGREVKDADIAANNAAWIAMALAQGRLRDRAPALARAVLAAEAYMVARAESVKVWEGDGGDDPPDWNDLMTVAQLAAQQAEAALFEALDAVRAEMGGSE